MAYRFQLDEPFEDGFRRIAGEQVAKARRLLASKSNPAIAVHEGRKGLKRLRALLRLFRPALGKEVFKAENVRYRDLARTLSHSRDQDVILAVLAGLRSECAAMSLSDDARDTLLGALDATHRAAANAGLPSDVETDIDGNDLSNGNAKTVDGTALNLRAREQAGLSLGAAHDALQNIILRRDTKKCVRAGLTICYRRGAVSLENAIASGVNDDLHEWRKDVQVHWRHMSLFKEAWPAYFTFRAETAKSLSDLLGRHHDFDLVIGYVGTLDNGTLCRKSRDALCDILRVLQDDLRRDAIDLGEMLFADDPDEFAKRILRYWKAARRAQARRKGQPDDVVGFSARSRRAEREVTAQTVHSKR